MRISRFCLPDLSPADTLLTLPQASAHYLANVLRLGVGAPVQVFDGQGHEFSAEVAEVSRKQVTLRLGARVETQAESPLRVHVALALTRGERMDYAIQKATELGATAFTPVITERCEVKLKGDRADRRLEHWQQVAMSACEQCGRSIVPHINPPLALGDFLSRTEAGLKLLLDHRQSKALPVDSPVDDILILSGPEGGFTDSEITAGIAAGFQAVKLGNRVLRAETAPVAVLSVLQWVWGDFGE